MTTDARQPVDSGKTIPISRPWCALAGFLTVVAVSVLVAGCVRRTSPEQRELEFQYRYLAVAMESAKPCFLISAESEDYYSFNPPGDRRSRRRSRCFSDAAITTRDPQWCDFVPPADPESLHNQETCKSRLAAGPGSVAPQHPDLVRLLPMMGYLENEAAYWQGKQRGMSFPDIRKMKALVMSEDFFQRIEHLASFGTEADKEKMRTVAWRPPKPVVQGARCAPDSQENCFVGSKD